MNLIDENIPKSQRQLLESWRIAIRQIGVNVGNSGMQDAEIISLLQQSRRISFFTRDNDFFKPDLRHLRYGLFYLDVEKEECAVFIRRILKHSEFNTQAKRMGRVVRISQTGLSCWQMNVQKEIRFNWA